MQYTCFNQNKCITIAIFHCAHQFYYQSIERIFFLVFLFVGFYEFYFALELFLLCFLLFFFYWRQWYNKSNIIFNGMSEINFERHKIAKIVKAIIIIKHIQKYREKEIRASSIDYKIKKKMFYDYQTIRHDKHYLTQWICCYCCFLYFGLVIYVFYSHF